MRRDKRKTAVPVVTGYDYSTREAIYGIKGIQSL